MFTAFDYINGVVVLPDSRILVTRRTPSNQVSYIDDFKASFQCAVVDGEREIDCLTEEIEHLFGIDVGSSQYSKTVDITKIGSIRKEGCVYKTTIYVIRLVKAVTLSVEKGCEMRTLPLEVAINEALHPVLVAYHTENGVVPNYTSTATKVLQEIKRRGGITKCTTTRL